jgi:hypothetical protein
VEVDDVCTAGRPKAAENNLPRVPVTPYLNQSALLLSSFFHFSPLPDRLIRPEPMLMLMLRVSRLLLILPLSRNLKGGWIR